MINELLWRITYRCNKKCSFCFNNVFDEKVDYFALEYFEMKKVLKFIDQHKITKVYLSGGEPSLVDNLFNIIRAFAQKVQIVVFTNGLFFEKYSIDEILSLPPISINVSIPLNDILEETQWFKCLMNSIEQIKLKKSDITINTQLMITSEYFRLINSYGFSVLSAIIDRVFWQPLAVPRDHNLYDTTIEGMPSDMVNRILDDIEMSENPEMKEHVRYIRDVLAGKEMAFCKMGKRYITLNPDMTLNICPHKDEPRLNMEDFVEASSFWCEKFSMRCVCLYSHLERRYLD